MRLFNLLVSALVLTLVLTTPAWAQKGPNGVGRINLEGYNEEGTITNRIASCEAFTVTSSRITEGYVELFSVPKEARTSDEVREQGFKLGLFSEATNNVGVRVFPRHEQVIGRWRAEGENPRGARLTLECDEHAFGSLSPRAGGGIQVPDMSVLGGDVRSQSAILIDTSFMGIRMAGAGLDVDGSLYTSGCATGANATSDHTCIQTASPSALTLSVGSATAALSPSIFLDAADPQLALLCRDSVTFAHEFGTTNDTAITSSEVDNMPFVFHDASEDRYRFLAANAPLNCVTGASAVLSANNHLLYPTTTSDTVQHFMPDQVHANDYGSKFLAQTVAEFSYEDITPGVLGVDNLLTNGYFELPCTGTQGAGIPFTVSAGTFSTRAPRTTDGFHGPIVGDGCQWASPGVGGTATTPDIAGQAGDYYVGSFFVSSGSIGTGRDLSLQIRDDADNPITNARFWVAGQPSGTLADLANDIDAAGALTAGEYNFTPRSFYGGGIIKFAFRLQEGDTGFNIRFETGVDSPMYFDEFWVRRKIHPNLDRNKVFADGYHKLAIFGDSRIDEGVGGSNRLPSALDYMFGFPDAFGNTRASLSPDVIFERAPSSEAWFLSGGRLGDYVGDVKIDGTTPIDADLTFNVPRDATDCLGFFGVNDYVGGTRPSTAALEGDTGNEERYFIDQIREFEVAMMKNSCRPFFLLDTKHRVDTNLNSCVNSSGIAQNCGTFHNELLETLLHEGTH